MKTLSQLLSQETIRALRGKIDDRSFPGISFEDAMSFILSDGILPRSNLPAQSFLKLEDWLREHGKEEALTYTASELKNKTGEILENVLKGKTVRLVKHGRPIAEIRKLAD